MSSAPPQGAAPRAALVDLLGLLLTMLALLVACKLTRPPALVPVIDLPAATCDLQRAPCRLDLPDGALLELNIAGRPLRPVQPFVVEARREGSLLPLEISIRGIEIAMSSPAQPFTRDTDGSYRVAGMLPLCTVSRMNWEASVLLEAGGRRLRWPLFFATDSG